MRADVVGTFCRVAVLFLLIWLRVVHVGDDHVCLFSFGSGEGL